MAINLKETKTQNILVILEMLFSFLTNILGMYEIVFSMTEKLR